jgi:hypothetical protein
MPNECRLLLSIFVSTIGLSKMWRWLINTETKICRYLEMNNSMKIRPLRFCHLEAVRAVRVSPSVRADYVGDIMVDLARPSLLDIRDRRGNTWIYHGVFLGDRLIGYITSVVRVEMSMIYIVNLVVDSRHIGRGLGSAALGMYLRTTCLGYKIARCHIELSNVRSIRLFTSHGFKLESYSPKTGCVFRVVFRN